MGRATALQLVAGGIAGFIVPFSSVVLAPGFRVAEVGPWIAISLVSAVLVALFGAGIPLLVAWISWLAVSGSRRGLRREVLAVVFGAIVGSLIVLAFIAAFGDLWIYVATVLTLGGMPGVAFALWVAAAWRRERKAPAVASQ